MAFFSESEKAWQRVSGFFLLLFAATLPHSIAAAQISAGLAVLPWLVQLLWKRRRPARTPLDLPIAGFILVSFLAAAFSLEPAVSLAKSRGVLWILLVVFIADFLRSRRQTFLLVGVLLVSATAGALYTVGEKIAGDGVAIEELSAVSPLGAVGVEPGDIVVACNQQRVRRVEELENIFMAAAGRTSVHCRALHNGEEHYEFSLPTELWSGPLGAHELGYMARTGRHARARGGYSHYTTYAEVLLQLTALACGLWLVYQGKSSWPGGLAVLVPVLLGVALLATLTRAAWMALALGLLAMVWMKLGWRWRMAALLVMALALVGANAALKEWRGVGLYDPSDPGTQYRRLMWADGLRLIGEHPLLGIGLDSIKTHWEELGIRAYREFPLRSHFHSTPIQLAVERGLLGLAAWGVIVVVYLMVLVKMLARRREQDWRTHGVILGIFGGVCGFLLSGLVHYNLGDTEVAMTFWCLAGVALALRHQEESAKSESA